MTIFHDYVPITKILYVFVMISVVHKLCIVHGKTMHISLRSCTAVNCYGSFPCFYTVF
jgi:hypothetical protein